MIPFVNLCAKSITLDHIILSQAQPPPKCISSCMKPLSILPKMDFLPFSVKSNMASIMSENLLSCRPSLPVTLTCAAPVTKKATKLMETMKEFLEPEILIYMPLLLLIEQNQILFEKVLHKQVDQIQSTQHVSCTPKLKEDFLEISMSEDLIMQDLGGARFGDSHLMRGFENADATVQFEKSADRSSPNSKQSLPFTSSLSPFFGFPFPIPKFNDDVSIWWSWSLLPNVLREIWTWPYKPFDFGQGTHPYLAFHGYAGLPLVSKTEEAFTADPALVVGPNLTKKFMDQAISPVLVKICERESHYVNIDKKNLFVVYIFLRNENVKKNVNMVMKKKVNHNCHLEESVDPVKPFVVGLDQHIFTDEADMKKMVDSLVVVDQETLDISVTKNVDDCHATTSPCNALARPLEQVYDNLKKNVKTHVEDDCHFSPCNALRVLDHVYDNVKNNVMMNVDEIKKNVNKQLTNSPSSLTVLFHHDLDVYIRAGAESDVSVTKNVDEDCHKVHPCNALVVVLDRAHENLKKMPGLDQNDLLKILPLLGQAKDFPDLVEQMVAKLPDVDQNDLMKIFPLVELAKDLPLGLVPSLTDEQMLVKDLPTSTRTLAEDAKDSSGAALILAKVLVTKMSLITMVAKYLPSLIPSLTEEQIVVKDLESDAAFILAQEMVAKMLGLDQKDLGPLKNFTHGVDLGMQEATNKKTTAGGPIFPTVAHGA